jgi:hypothetical protein
LRAFNQFVEFFLVDRPLVRERSVSISVPRVHKKFHYLITF